MAHDHGHSPHGHAHVHVHVQSDTRRLAIALAAIVGFMAVEVGVGIAVNSLALLSDAAHMLTDAAALGLSLLAIRLALRPATSRWTYGLKRGEALSAQANGATLLVLGGMILFEGVRRLVWPLEVGGGAVALTAIAGIGVNLFVAWQLARANRESLAVEGAFQHVLTDLYAFAGTAVAGAVIFLTGFNRADPIASLVVAGLMLRSAYGLLRASGTVLLEGAPPGMDVDDVGRALASHPGVTNVHDLHVWEIGSGFPALSAHVLVEAGADCHGIRRELELILRERYGIDHTTLQVDHAPSRSLLRIRARAGR